MPYQDILRRFQEQQDAAKAANEARYAESLELYDKIISTYQPEGGFLKGAYAELEREKGRTVAGQTQDLVSSGLFGTSTRAGLGSKWESEVGMPARLKLEDVRMGRLAQAIGGKAQAIERRDDIGPDYATVAQLATQAGAAPRQTGGRFSTGGGGQGSTRPSSYSSPSSTGPISGGGGGGRGLRPAGVGVGDSRPQFQYTSGPSMQTQEGMAMSREGATYMGGGSWRLPSSISYPQMLGYEPLAPQAPVGPRVQSKPGVWTQPTPTEYDYSHPIYRA